MPKAPVLCASDFPRIRKAIPAFRPLKLSGASRTTLLMFALRTALFGILLPAIAPASALAQAPSSVVQVTISDPWVSLNGPWHFSPGDSPWASGQFLWSLPGFDDSHWSTMELRPAAGVMNVYYGDSGYIPGWSSLGYPRLVGFAWYRIRIHVLRQDQPLAIAMPDHVDDAYQVFANGRFIGQMGRFDSGHVTCYRTQPIAFRLPPADAHGDIEVAIRFYEEPWVAFLGANMQGMHGSGGMHAVPSVSLAPAATSIVREHMRERWLASITAIFVSLLMLLAAGAAFCLWIMERRDGVYLWLALALMAWPAASVATLVGLFSFIISQDTAGVLSRLVISSGLVCWIVFWRKWFGLERNRRVYALPAWLLVLQAFIYLWIFELSGHSIQWIPIATQAGLACQFLLGALLLLTLVPAVRKDHVGVLLALGPVLLVIVDSFSAAINSWLGLPTSVTLQSGLQISLGDLAGLLAVLAIAVLAGRRFFRSRIEERLQKQILDQEMEQARELQQHVLIPEPAQAGCFLVKTAYHPALTVGGDFFQTIHQPDGSLLLVVGDVSGKGMAAAMLVAVLVGSIRTRAEETSSPAALLVTLNQRLLGRAGGHFATCIAAHLLPDGTVTLANAGHLPPYRNGQELEIDSGLPLGVTAQCEYVEAGIRLAPGETLTFLTDGVPEAQNPARELFGFDRTRQISTQSAEAIASTAQQFGQEDDITVLTLQFAPAEVLHA
jgi:Stage II sporulation protein E (SpoIIE)